MPVTRPKFVCNLPPEGFSFFIGGRYVSICSQSLWARGTSGLSANRLPEPPKGAGMKYGASDRRSAEEGAGSK
ncbi:hypothetical protein NDU88_003996 [Pleurodeles waltl]|uniref:Uncharacterized protein n=1 Tax=Pleurodeles waltl TaxID=8319 RepID=A0AAV7W7R1_PLEWA|nr:hypothetical protein NDU88_003996 [Pleurodeles waltl]